MTDENKAAQPGLEALVADRWNIEAAAMQLAECMDYPWAHMPEEGRQSMRESAQRILLSAAPAQPVAAQPAAPVAWARKWYIDGEQPAKERKENGRLAWPTKFKLLPLTPNKLCKDDVALGPIVAPPAQQESKDAQRYRVLRDPAYQMLEDDPCVSDDSFNTFFGDDLDKAADGLKARFDAAIAASKSKGDGDV